MDQLCGGGGDFSAVRAVLCCCEMFLKKYLHR